MKKLKRKSNTFRAADPPVPDAREVLIRELTELGDDLDSTLRRIGGYLAWVARDVKLLQNHAAALRDEAQKMEPTK